MYVGNYDEVDDEGMPVPHLDHPMVGSVSLRSQWEEFLYGKGKMPDMEHGKPRVEPPEGFTEAEHEAYLDDPSHDDNPADIDGLY